MPPVIGSAWHTPRVAPAGIMQMYPALQSVLLLQPQPSGHAARVLYAAPHSIERFVQAFGSARLCSTQRCSLLHVAVVTLPSHEVWSLTQPDVFSVRQSSFVPQQYVSGLVSPQQNP
jgi:hypothetical protein